MATTITKRSMEYSYTPNKTRTLTVQFDNWKWRKGTILDEDKTELYRVECHIRSPQIIIQPVLENISLSESRGEVTFHTLSSHIDLRLHNEDIKLISRGMLKDGYTYESPAQNGVKMTWQGKSKWDYLNLVCLNDKAMPVARISLTTWGTTKAGTIELAVVGVLNEGRERDEVILTGLAMLQLRLTAYYTSITS